MEKAGNTRRHYSRMSGQCDERGKDHDEKKNEFGCSKELLKEKRQSGVRLCQPGEAAAQGPGEWLGAGAVTVPGTPTTSQEQAGSSMNCVLFEAHNWEGGGSDPRLPGPVPPVSWDCSRNQTDHASPEDSPSYY